ncbi:MAG TPA: mechanosensitive ion channel family protein [Tepidisphaeraceae bacterium]|jgi:small-conductance mechanosensitive channel
MLDVRYIMNELLNPGRPAGAAFYALVVGVIAWLAGRALRLAVHRYLDGGSPRADRTAVNFLGQLAQLGIYVVAFLSYAYLIPVLHHLANVWLASVGVVSLVAGLAAQNTLGNLIAGISLLLYQPFELGDRLKVTAPTGLESGVLDSLSLGYTTILTDDNRRIVIPNSAMASQTFVNVTHAAPQTNCVITVTIGFAADIDKARSALTDLARNNPNVKEVVSCKVTALTKSGVELTLTARCTDAATAADVKGDLLEAAKKRFDAEQIGII